ncbi:retrovirus-related pol polyprotein from transposon TNT 1-94 [Tanacetum coccineum]
MTTLAEYIIVAGAENCPLMLEKSMYDSWARRIHLFIKGKKHGRMMLDSIDNDDCDVHATNVFFHGLPPDVYALVNHQEASKDIWDRVKLLIKGTDLSYQEHECGLYNLFDKFAYVQGETLYEYYWRFSQLINDMHTIGMTMQQVQVNTKFLNALPSEWSKFVTDVKYLDLLALVAKSPTLYNPSQSPQHLVIQQSQVEFPQLDSGLPLPMLQQGEDPIECINKAMSFLSAVASRFPPSNNQLITSSNPRNQATIQDGRVIVQQIQGRQSQSFAGTRNRGIATTSKGNYAAGQPRVVKCYNCQGEGHMARQCTQPKRPRNAAWFKEKLMLVEAQEAGQILDEEQLAYLADPGISEAPIAQQTIPQNSAFQTEDLDAYDSDCDDLSSAKAVLMENILSCDPEVLSKVPYSDSYLNDMINQEVQEMQYSEKTHIDDFQDNEIHSDSNIIINAYANETTSFYNDTHKQALGYQNSFHLKKAQRIQPTLYDGSVITKEHVVISMFDDEETLILEEESRSKMLDKQNDLISIEKKIKISPINYSKLNKIKEDFGKRFVTQNKLSAEQAFWLKHSSFSKSPVTSHTSVRIEAPSELPKVILVNESLKKLKYQLANFDNVVKKRTTSDAITAGAWGFEHNKAYSFDVKKSCVNDCNKCLELETGLLKKNLIEKDVYDKLLKSYSTLEKHCISLELTTQLNQEVFQKDNFRENQNAPTFNQLFELNELKAQSQEKDTVIRKLKDMIKSLSGKDSLENVKKDIDEIEFNLKHKGKNVVDTVVSKPNATIAPGMFKLDIEPISHRLKNNRDAHEVYIEKTIENTDTLRGFVERARTQNPSEPLLESACMFTKHVQELLVYVSQTCPNSPKPSEKLVAVTPMNKDKRVRFAEPVTSSSNIPKQTDSLKTKDSNKPLLTSTGVKPTTSASRSKPSGNTKNNRITRPPSSNQKNKVEDHSRKVKSSLNKMNSISEPVSNALVKHSVRNAKFESICAICNKCLFDANHDMCIIDYVNDVNVRSKSKSKRNKMRKVWKPTVPPKETTALVVTPTSGILVYSRRPKATRSVGSSSKVKIVESKTSNSKEPKQSWGSTISDVPSSSLNDCRFGNDHIAKIMGYGDYQMGNVTISRVYYVEGLGHNLFFVGQFCDSDLEVAFRKHTCFIRDLDGVDLLKGSRGLPKLKYQKDHLCSACALGKSKKHSHKPKAEDSIQEKLYLLHMDLCGPMRVQSINGRKYILVIVDDFSRFTWVKFLRSKDEVLEFVIKFLKMIQVRLNATVRNIRTDNGTEFVNQTLKAYYEEVGISHQTSVARTPQQNGVVERRNRTLVEAARTMLIFSKAPLFLWAEAVATACYTQNRSLIRKRHNKTPYELLHDQKPDLSYLHVFGALCYPTNDGEDLGKLKPKADIGIFVGYAPAKKAF